MRSLPVSVQRSGRVDGDRTLLRCRLPFAFGIDGAIRRRIVLDQGAQRAVGEDPEDDVEGELGQWEEIEGPASSTSIDWYGTRMSRNALESMARQFSSGVDYFPRHHSWLAPVEWYGVIGRTHGAEIKAEQVREPADGGENLVLYVRTRVDMGTDLGDQLVRRLMSGWRIGQSIGGWFTEIAVRYDEDGDVVDVEILDLELDHLAAVRSPACPDADRLWLAASRAILEARGSGAALDAARAAHPDVEVESTGDEVIVRCVLPDLEPAQGDDFRSAIRSAPTGSPASRSSADPAVDDGAPRPDPATTTAREEEAMPLDEATLAAIAAAVRSVTEPLAVQVAALQADRAAPAPVVPATPSPAVSAPAAPSDDLASFRARVEAAEQRAERAELTAREARAAARIAQTQAQTGAPVADRTVPTHTPAPAAPASDDVIAGIRGKVEGPGGCDLRSIAPNACRAHFSSRGLVELSPGLVMAEDGVKGLVAYAKAEGKTPALVQLSEENPILTIGHRRRGSVARDIAAHYGDVRSQLTAGSDVKPGWQDRGALEDLLADVFEAAQRDGLLKPRTLWLD